MNIVDLVCFDYFVYVEKLKKNFVFLKQNLMYLSGDIFFCVFYLFICLYYDVN